MTTSSLLLTAIIIVLVLAMVAFAILVGSVEHEERKSQARALSRPLEAPSLTWSTSVRKTDPWNNHDPRSCKCSTCR